MSDKIRFNFEALENMANQCTKVQNELMDLMSQSNDWASILQNSALQGPTGTKFAEALGIFGKKVNQLADQFGEEVKDIQGAKNDMMSADSNTSKNF